MGELLSAVGHALTGLHWVEMSHWCSSDESCDDYSIPTGFHFSAFTTVSRKGHRTLTDRRKNRPFAWFLFKTSDFEARCHKVTDRNKQKKPLLSESMYYKVLWMRWSQQSLMASSFGRQLSKLAFSICVPRILVAVSSHFHSRGHFCFI